MARLREVVADLGADDHRHEDPRRQGPPIEPVDHEAESEERLPDEAYRLTAGEPPRRRKGSAGKNEEEADRADLGAH